MDPVTMPGTSLPQAVDPEIHDLKKKFYGIDLSPSEIVPSFPVDGALGYALTNEYSRGMASNRRCYGGDHFIDELKKISRNRALQGFRLYPACWGVIIQPYSGSAAKVAPYTTFLEHHRGIMGLNRIMSLDLPSGVHPTHRYDTSGSEKIYFESNRFDFDPSTGYIDYNKLYEKALNFCPHLIICGSSAYPRDWDYAHFCFIANKCGALLLCDMADISGLIAAQEAANPFEYCDIVTMTTNKSLRVPIARMIFYRKGLPALHNFEDKTAVFPSLQGGLHNHQIGVLAVFLKQAMSPESKAYAKQVKANAVALGNYLFVGEPGFNFFNS